MKPASSFLLIAVFLVCRAFGAEEITLENISYFPNPFDDTERRYVLPLDDNPNHDIIFVAQRLARDGTWMLNFSIGRLSITRQGEKPDNNPLDQIPGKEKLLFRCLDRFLADVPGARVCLVDIDLRLSEPLWTDFRKHMEPVFKGKRGIVAEGDDQVEKVVRDYLNKSPVAGKLASSLAAKLHGKLINAQFADDWVLFENRYYGQQWPALLASPNLGFEMEFNAFGVSLKPNPPAKK